MGLGLTDYFDGCSTQQSGFRTTPVHGRDRQVIVGCGIVKQYLDLVISFPYIFRDVETPGRSELQSGFLLIYPDFGCGDHLSQVQIYFISVILFQMNVFPVPGTAGVSGKTLYLCPVSCGNQTVPAGLFDRTVDSGASGISPGFFYGYGYG